MTRSRIGVAFEGLEEVLVDPDDDLPLWDVTPGTALVDGTLAWDRLSVGNRCETWLAWSAMLWSPVIVKLARPHQTGPAGARPSLAREVAALDGNLSPAIPRLIADGVDAATPYVVVEYIDGPALAELVDDGPLDHPSTARLGIYLLTAVFALHRGGLAHLDVKSENVVVRDGRPMLVDFGSARQLGRLQPAGQPIGALGYAPRRWRRADRSARRWTSTVSARRCARR